MNCHMPGLNFFVNWKSMSHRPASQTCLTRPRPTSYLLETHPLKYGFLKKSFNYECTFVSWPFPVRCACGHVDVGTRPRQVLASTLTLSQPRGADYDLPILMSTPSFESHRRACQSSLFGGFTVAPTQKWWLEMVNGKRTFIIKWLLKISIL